MIYGNVGQPRINATPDPVYQGGVRTTLYQNSYGYGSPSWTPGFPNAWGYPESYYFASRRPPLPEQVFPPPLTESQKKQYCQQFYKQFCAKWPSDVYCSQFRRFCGLYS